MSKSRNARRKKRKTKQRKVLKKERGQNTRDKTSLDVHLAEKAVKKGAKLEKAPKFTCFLLMATKVGNWATQIFRKSETKELN